MLRKNQLVPLDIVDLTHEGSGVGRYEGIAVLVPRTAVGDKIIARIVKIRTGFAFGIVEEIEKESEDRIPVDCPVFSRCGGCALRHISYEAELKAKQSWVAGNLSRIGGISVPLEPIVPSPCAGRYRNKAQYPVREINGMPHTGLFAPRSHALIPVEDCLLQPEHFSALCGELLGFMRTSGIRAYDEKAHSGLIRHIYMRYAESSKETLLCIVANGQGLPQEEKLYEALRHICPGELSLYLSSNTRKTNVILGADARHIAGPKHITDVLAGVSLSLSPHSFYQVNRGAAELLYQTALEYANPSPGGIVLDLYCGAGSVGLSMAKKAGRVIGIETVPQAVEDAKANAKANGGTNADFFCEDAEDAAKRLSEEGLRPEVIVLDPPRAGAEAQTLRHIAEMKPDRIVYISCNSATLARDCATLQSLGYRFVKGRCVDMFPRTNHVECVALLEKTLMAADNNY